MGSHHGVVRSDRGGRSFSNGFGGHLVGKCSGPTKYPKAADTLSKDREALLAFYDFPAAHWQSIRTTNPIESTFATVRLRTARTRGCVIRNTILSLAFKLGHSVHKRWLRLCGYQWLERGITFIDGIENTNPPNANESPKTNRGAA